MKKAKVFFLLFFLTVCMQAWALDAQQKNYEGSGEVTSVDPLYSRVSIKHSPIKGFRGGPETEFFVSSSDILKTIHPRDLVDFTITEAKGEAMISKMTITGQAPIKDDRLQVGKAVQEVLVATGEVAKTVTGPLPPANQVVSGAVGATTDTTGSVLEEADGAELKTKF